MLGGVGGGVPMLIKEHWGIENDPFWCAFPVIILNFCDQDSWKHALNCSQYIVSDTNNFKLDFDKKLNSWLKFQPNFLAWLPYAI